MSHWERDKACIVKKKIVITELLIKKMRPNVNARPKTSHWQVINKIWYARLARLTSVCFGWVRTIDRWLQANLVLVFFKICGPLDDCHYMCANVSVCIVINRFFCWIKCCRANHTINFHHFSTLYSMTCSLLSTRFKLCSIIHNLYITEWHCYPTAMLPNARAHTNRKYARTLWQVIFNGWTEASQIMNDTEENTHISNVCVCARRSIHVYKCHQQSCHTKLDIFRHLLHHHHYRRHHHHHHCHHHLQHPNICTVQKWNDNIAIRWKDETSALYKTLDLIKN